jgi:hypothetical protein
MTQVADYIETHLTDDMDYGELAGIVCCSVYQFGRVFAYVVNEPATMEIAYHVTGERRKELVKAISQITCLSAKYQNAPTFAFAIGGYMVDKVGMLTGVYNAALVEALAEQGFIAG